MTYWNFMLSKKRLFECGVGELYRSCVEILNFNFFEFLEMIIFDVGYIKKLRNNFLSFLIFWVEILKIDLQKYLKNPFSIFFR